MQLFLDTNICLDLLLQREFKDEALIILNSIDEGLLEGFLLDITLVNIDYVSRKQGRDATQFLQHLNRTCHIVGINNHDVEKALSLKHNDFEDALQYIAAQKHRCNIIVSNDKAFYKGDIELISSQKFVEKFYL